MNTVGVKVVCFTAALCLGVTGYGQIPLPEKQSVTLNTDTAAVRKLTYSLSMGTSFISSSGAGNGTSYFIAPQINYHFSTKLNVTAGLIINQNNYSLPVHLFNQDSRSVVIRSIPVNSQNLFYASGNYELSNRILLSGSVITSFPTSDLTQNNGFNNSFRTVSMGLTYMITDKITFNAGMRITQSNGLNYFPRSYNSLMDYGMYPY